MLHEVPANGIEAAIGWQRLIDLVNETPGLNRRRQATGHDANQHERRDHNA